MNIPSDPLSRALHSVAMGIASDQGIMLDGGPDEAHTWAVAEAHCHALVTRTLQRLDPDTADWDAIARATGFTSREEVEAGYGLDETPQPF